MKAWMLRSAGVLFSFAVLLGAGAYVLDDWIRDRTLSQVNAALIGYSAEMEDLDLNPLLLGFSLDNLVIRQDAHPEPPVARFREMSENLHWQALLRGKLVAEFTFEQPELHLNREQFMVEQTDERPVAQKGWQQALEAVYPLELNRLLVERGKFTYVKEKSRSVELRDIKMTAQNIRNVQNPDEPYPSTVLLEAAVPESGRFRLDGRANFLMRPHPGVDAETTLENVDLKFLAPVFSEVSLRVFGGILNAEGQVEYGPEIKRYVLRRARIERPMIDYVHRATTAQSEAQRIERVKQAAEQAQARQDVEVIVEKINLEEAELGFVNLSESPDYRLFVTDLYLTMTNFSDGFQKGNGALAFNGQFMGSGNAAVTGVFRPAESGPDFDLSVIIEDSRVTALNPLLQAHADFDTTQGSFSLYSEVSIANGEIHGYVKPFVQDLDVYSPEQDKHEEFFQRTYEALIGGVAEILENQPDDQVASKFDIAGPLSAPEMNTGQAILQLIRNAFFDAILPGLERGEEDRASNPRRRVKSPAPRHAN